MKLLLQFFIFSLLIPVHFANAAQSERSIISANGKVIQRYNEFLAMQSRVDPARINPAVETIRPYLNKNNLQLTNDLMALAERSEPDSMIRFLVLNSLGDLHLYEDPSTFDRLVHFFENPETPSADTTAASNSIRSSAIRSGNQELLTRLITSVLKCKNQRAVADYIFYLGQERKLLINTSWFIPFILQKATDQKASAQVRINAVTEIDWTLDDYATTLPPVIVNLMLQKLLEAFHTEQHVEAKAQIISRISTLLITPLRKELEALLASNPPEKIRNAAEYALKNGTDLKGCEYLLVLF